MKVETNNAQENCAYISYLPNKARPAARGNNFVKSLLLILLCSQLERHEHIFAEPVVEASPEYSRARLDDAAAPPASLFRKWCEGDRSVLDPLMKLGGPVFTALAKDAREEPAKTGLSELALAWVRRRLENSLRDEGGIRYLGQFKELRDLEPYVRDALLKILHDEDLAIDLRMRSAQALGDVSDASILPALRALLDDFLIEEWLEQELGFLLARFGDRSFVEKEITAAEALLAREHPGGAAIPSLLEAHARLAEIYYRTADYSLAARHYEQRIVLLEDLVAIVTTQVRQALHEEIAVLYYNLACAHALTGRLDDAFKALETALEKRGVSMAMLENDGDLLALRQDRRFSEWLANQRTKFKEPNSKPPE